MFIPVSLKMQQEGERSTVKDIPRVTGCCLLWLHSWSAGELQQLWAQSCLGLHKWRRETLCPRWGRCAESARDAGDTWKVKHRRCWWPPQLVLSVGCSLSATLPWEFYVDFRDYLWFQGKHNWREHRAWQLYISWDSCTGKLFPFTLLGLQAGPDPALMKTIPQKSSAFLWVGMDGLFAWAESGR